MKKTLLFLLIFFCSFATAQKYSFDYIIINTEQCIKPKISSYIHRQQVAIKTLDRSYELYIGTDGFARLDDFKKNKSYHFSIEKNETNGNLTFKYFDSKKSYDFPETLYKISKISTNEYLIQIYRNKKRNRIDSEIKLKLKEVSANVIFVNGHISIKGRNLISSDLAKITDTDKNFVVENSTIDYKNDLTCETNLQNFTKTELVIEVPEK